VDVRNPSSVRPWQHVLEPLGGYLKLGALLDKDPAAYSKAYNFGPLPDDHLTVRALVETAIASWGSGNWTDRSAATQPHEAGLLKLDISRAKKELNWEPRLTAREAIEWTIGWYKIPEEQQAEYSFRQINNYFEL